MTSVCVCAPTVCLVFIFSQSVSSFRCSLFNIPYYFIVASRLAYTITMWTTFHKVVWFAVDSVVHLPFAICSMLSCKLHTCNNTDQLITDLIGSDQIKRKYSIDFAVLKKYIYMIRLNTFVRCSGWIQHPILNLLYNCCHLKNFSCV